MAGLSNVQKVLQENNLAGFRVALTSDTASSFLKMQISTDVKDVKETKDPTGSMSEGVRLYLASLNHYLNLHSKLSHIPSLRAFFLRKFLLRRLDDLKRDFPVLVTGEPLKLHEIQSILERVDYHLLEVANYSDRFYSGMFSWFFGNTLDNTSYIRSLCLAFSEEANRMKGVLFQLQHPVTAPPVKPEGSPTQRMQQQFAPRVEELTKANKELKDRNEQLLQENTRLKEDLKILEAAERTFKKFVNKCMAIVGSVFNSIRDKDALTSEELEILKKTLGDHVSAVESLNKKLNPDVSTLSQQPNGASSTPNPKLRV